MLKMRKYNFKCISIFLLSVTSVFSFVSTREGIPEIFTKPLQRERRSAITSNDNHKPVFMECGKYNPNVKEEEPKGTFVIQVQATDEDPLEFGGNLTYKFVLRDGERGKFVINNVTGVITTLHSFDRDEPAREKEIYVTVQATDNGRPTLADVCTFKITIQDINDNSPMFDKTTYSESIPQDLYVNREVMRISATDIDDGNNSVVTYSIDTTNPNNYFRIDESNGIIYLNESLIPSVAVGKTFKILATARDNGIPPNTVTTELEIKIVDSYKKPPAFIEEYKDPIYLKENYDDYDANIVTLKATSNIENSELLFFLETGRTEQTNKASTFILFANNDTASIRLGRSLDYESNTEYTLLIRVQNKDLLSAVTKITIKVEDVNDNIPSFLELVYGTVLENEEPGTPVMQVQAVDLDGTEANNIVSYELADNLDKFQIDRNTGNITTKTRFDREDQNVYRVKVIAKDNSPSALKKHSTEPNSAEQVFHIEIEDKNDNPPKFTKSVYVADNIPENIDMHKVVIEVKAEDRDTASIIKYDIKEGNIGDAFFIEEKTGKIRVQNQLDYETRTSYELRVVADDGKFNDTAIVKINIENVNDMLPEFYNFTNDISFEEETLVAGCLVKVTAYDPDISDRNAPQNIVYTVRPVKGDTYLSIDEEGCIRLTKTLDRDPPYGSVDWQAIVTAYDENGTASSQHTTRNLFIHLKDINDNAPFLNVTEVVWQENRNSTDHPIIILTAEDYDDNTINGPPFKYNLVENSTKEILESFRIEGDALYPRKTFDREQKKSYSVFIAITDNGKQPMTGISNLKVIIGDENDNPMRPGSSEIFVNSVGDRMPDTVIGRVYVEDPDDWDLPDKKFHWESEKPDQFELNHNNGEITLKRGTKPGKYHLSFKVSEQSKYFEMHDVIAKVTVIVKDIPDEAIKKSGSIRLYGSTSEDFINVPDPNSPQNSMKEKLHNQLCNLLNVSRENLDILSILHSPFYLNESYLDIRYSAHGSPYYAPEKLNTFTTLEQEKLDAVIQMINIAECMDENVCPNLSCTNYLNISDEPYVVNTNRTSFVGISAIVEPKCSCEVPNTEYCLNEGVLLENSICQCKEGYEGIHCEFLNIGFYGTGYALFPTFQTCYHSEITLEIITTQENGLIFYVGPLRENPLLPVKDFMSLEIRKGYPLLLVDYGTGTVEVEQKYKKINDGEKHFIYIMFQQTSVELRVDNCAMSKCVEYRGVQGPNKALNVNGPLQIGGTIMNMQKLASKMGWKYTPSNQGFSGLVRNFTYNGKTYDLRNPAYAVNVKFDYYLKASAVGIGIDSSFLVALLVCVAILLILLLAVVVHRRKQDNYNDKDLDDIRENIINYEDEGGGEVDTGFDLDVLRRENYFDEPQSLKQKESLYGKTPDTVPDISGFLEVKKELCDKDPDCNPFDDVRYYAYEGDGSTSRSSLSSLASCTDEGDLKFNYLSNFGPRFRKLADMYGEEPSDDDDQDAGEESWC